MDSSTPYVGVSCFVTYGIPDELSSDGGPEFVAAATRDFLKSWGVHHRLSSVAFPHSNSRAEIGVKTVKRAICNNTGPGGTLDTDAFQRAMLQYRNCPDKETKLSPAMCVFGRPTRDFIPILPGRYRPHDTWRETLAAREEALRNRHMRAAERWLRPLVVSDQVRIQNQTGPNPRKWDNTGHVIEVRQHDQYVIRVDGSGRVTLRNMKFLRKYIPVQPPRPRLGIMGDLHGHTPQPYNTGEYLQKHVHIAQPTPSNMTTTPPTPDVCQPREIPPNPLTPRGPTQTPQRKDPVATSVTWCSSIVRCGTPSHQLRHARIATYMHSTGTQRRLPAPATQPGWGQGTAVPRKTSPRKWTISFTWGRIIPF